MTTTLHSFSKCSLLALVATFLASACSKSDKAGADTTSDTKAKLAELEKKVAAHEKFLAPIMAQQKAQEAQRAASEPDPTARFAVDVTGNFTHGPPTAAVTIIEAWDFA